MAKLLNLLCILASGLAANSDEVIQAQFGPIGWPEIIIISLIVMLLFGARKLPDIGRGLGRAIANFKRSVKEEPRKIEEADEEEAEDKAEEKEEKKESKKE